MTAIPTVNVNALGFHAGDIGHVLSHGVEGMAIERSAMQGLGVQHKVPTRCRVNAGGDRYLATKFIGFIGFAFADAFDFRRMPAVDFL